MTVLPKKVLRFLFSGAEGVLPADRQLFVLQSVQTGADRDGAARHPLHVSCARNTGFTLCETHLSAPQSEPQVLPVLVQEFNMISMGPEHQEMEAKFGVRVDASCSRVNTAGSSSGIGFDDGCAKRTSCLWRCFNFHWVALDNTGDNTN